MVNASFQMAILFNLLNGLLHHFVDVKCKTIAFIEQGQYGLDMTSFLCTLADEVRGREAYLCRLAFWKCGIASAVRA